MAIFLVLAEDQEPYAKERNTWQLQCSRIFNLFQHL